VIREIAMTDDRATFCHSVAALASGNPRCWAGFPALFGVMAASRHGPQSGAVIGVGPTQLFDEPEKQLKTMGI